MCHIVYTALIPNLISLTTRYHLVCLFFLAFLAVTKSVLAESNATTSNDPPYFEYVEHNVGKIAFRIHNNGLIGITIIKDDPFLFYFPDTTFRTYPKSSKHIFPVPFLVIGGIVGRDTLVSVGEFFPATFEEQILNDEQIKVFSINDPITDEEHQALSQQDISFTYYDTLADPSLVGANPYDNRPHRPLNLRIRHKSYAWSFDNIDDFVLFDLTVENVGLKRITKMYIGIELLGNVSGLRPLRDDQARGEICGILRSFDASEFGLADCFSYQEIDIAWVAGRNGEPNPSSGEFDIYSPTEVVGIRILNAKLPGQSISFNWWHTGGILPGTDFGPRQRGTTEAPFRDFGGRLGTPGSDNNMYYVLSSGEIDYNQLLTALDHSASGWLPPPLNADSMAMARGLAISARLLSIGPFDLAPGEVAPISFAYIGGEGFHTDPKNLDNWNPNQPQKYIDNLDLSDLIKNATWASWVYDNPGFDTDNDGYRGESYVCETAETKIIDTTIVVDTFVFPPETTLILDTTVNPLRADTIFFSGDGVPDIRGVIPPSAPEVRVSSSHGQLIIEWNGLKSETTPDIFTQEIDFEGYRAYLGLAKRKSDLHVLSSYDIEDYTQYYFKLRPGTLGKGDWVVLRKPFSLREAQLAYAGGNPDYDPLFNEIENPLSVGDSVFYFVRQDFNQSDLSDTTAMHRLYPDAPYPHTLDLGEAFTEDTWYVDELTGDSVFYEGGELTPDGKYFKFFEYRYVAENLLPSLAYFVSVTAFDFGSPELGVPFLETNPVTTAIEAFALDPTEQQPQGGLNVIVYPNPYRIDGNYREQGFEARGREDLPDFRTREIHFINLPPNCTIRVFSVDGDLVSQIEHDRFPSDPSAMHEFWNLLTRNTQLATSGIYYWVIETPEGDSQIGKLVLIM